MLETLPDSVVFFGGFAIVTLLVLGRLYVGEQFFNDQGWFWRPLRKHIIPWFHRVFQDADDELYAETKMREIEYVGTLEKSWQDVKQMFFEANYQHNPLASLATDPNGNVEEASLSWYHGESIFSSPEFLKPRQVHVRLFDVSTPIGPRTAIYAHEEATSWRPDLWRDHYAGESMDVDLGVNVARYDLGLDSEIDQSTDPSLIDYEP